LIVIKLVTLKHYLVEFNFATNPFKQ